jgi:flagellar biosynthetic protein FlhB
MSSEDFSERTEEPTPEKRQRARDEGQMARSRDGGAVAATAAVLLVVLSSGTAMLGVVRTFAVQCFQNPRQVNVADTGRIFKDFATGLAAVSLPMALAAALGGIGAGLLEAGFRPRLELAAPKWSRLNPVGKFQQLFSLRQGSVNAIMALLRVAAVGAVAYSVIKADFPGLARVSRTELSSGLLFVGHLILRITVGCIVALAVLALLDYGQSWRRLQRELMMTRQELKEELRQQEGDPKVRARIRQRARELAKRGIAKEVRRADVVVANPTHVSVALRYRAMEGAPVVVAKGYDEVALFIRKIAEESDIVVVENRPLAWALADRAKVGKMIPVDLYQAVAQVLAFVYRMKRNRWRG